MPAMFNLIPSLFPQILFLAPFAAFIIRITLACVFATAAWSRRAKTAVVVRGIMAIEFALALALLMGFYTQASALVAAFVLVVWLARGAIRPFSQSTVVLALVMVLTLVVTGAGPFGLDFPF